MTSARPSFARRVAPTGKLLPMQLRSPLLTERLLLREVIEADVDALAALRQDVTVRAFLGGELAPDDAATKALATIGVPGCFAVMRDTELIGLVSLLPRGEVLELSYESFPRHWRQGLAREACDALMAEATRSGEVQSVVAVTQRANERSRLLLESLGMSLGEEFEEFGAPQVLYEASSSA